MALLQWATPASSICLHQTFQQLGSKEPAGAGVRAPPSIAASFFRSTSSSFFFCFAAFLFASCCFRAATFSSVDCKMHALASHLLLLLLDSVKQGDANGGWGGLRRGGGSCWMGGSDHVNSEAAVHGADLRANLRHGIIDGERRLGSNGLAHLSGLLFAPRRLEEKRAGSSKEKRAGSSLVCGFADYSYSYSGYLKLICPTNSSTLEQKRERDHKTTNPNKPCPLIPDFRLFELF